MSALRFRSRTLIFTVLLIASGILVWLAISNGLLPIKVGSTSQLPSESRGILESADEFVLYSLDPISIEYLKPGEDHPKEVLHDFPVLGKVEILDLQERQELLDALYAGIAASDGMAANCFNPRHAIRAKRGSATTELMICFECLQIAIHSKKKMGATTTAAPQLTFDEILKRHGIPLPLDNR